MYLRAMGVSAFVIAFFASTSAQPQSLTNKKPIVFIWAEDLQTNNQRPLGSGFILGMSGDVLTARHVVEQAVEGEQLVVSISSKSNFPVEVDMTDVDCDTTQDFCFIRVPADVIGDRVTEFFNIGCYIPPPDTPLMAAGFFAGGSRHSGIVIPRGNSIGNQIEGGLLPTSIPLEPGMSGGPVFDSNMLVVGIVKGGSSQFGHVQPLQRARSALANRGYECTTIRDSASLEKELIEIETVILDIRKSLGLKNQVILALDAYLNRPNIDGWHAVQGSARRDQEQITEAIDRALDFSAKYNIDGVESIMANLRQTPPPVPLVDLSALDSITATWNSRFGTLVGIPRDDPGSEFAVRLRNDMLQYQIKLKSDFDRLINVFRTRFASMQ